MITLKLLAALGLLIVAGTGCGGGGDNHTPPAGMGSIMVRNYTGDGILVYVNGAPASSTAGASSTTPYDLQPGSYRVTLTESHGWRSWSGFVDVLENRLTYLDVQLNLQNIYAYAVAIFFD